MRIYLFPYQSKSSNPYINAFHKALGNCHKMTNSTVISVYFNLLLDMLKQCIKTDVLILNWPENAILKRGGVFQTFFLIFILLLYNILKKKIVYIFHNKVPHTGNRLQLYISRFCSEVILKISSQVVVHSRSGISFLQSQHPFLENKIRFVMHPVYSGELIEFENTLYDYDFIIWGSIMKYKGIVKFLIKMKEQISKKNIRLLIVGRCKDDDYRKQIQDIIRDNKNISFVEGFISDDQLDNYISLSKCILFVYDSDSLLSSGALIKSLNYARPIIGPNFDTFKDLKDIHLINVYENYSDIFSSSNFFDEKKRKKFLTENTWEKLSPQVI